MFSLFNDYKSVMKKITIDWSVDGVIDIVNIKPNIDFLFDEVWKAVAAGIFHLVKNYLLYIYLFSDDHHILLFSSSRLEHFDFRLKQEQLTISLGTWCFLVLFKIYDSVVSKLTLSDSIES